MKLLSIIVLVWAVVCLCLGFVYHDMFYTTWKLIAGGFWILITIGSVYMHETGTPWPWKVKNNG